MKNVKLKGSLRDASSLHIPVYLKDGDYFPEGWFHKIAGFENGKKVVYDASTVRIGTMIDLVLFIEKYGTVKFKKGDYENIPVKMVVSKTNLLFHKAKMKIRHASNKVITGWDINMEDIRQLCSEGREVRVSIPFSGEKLKIEVC